MEVSTCGHLGLNINVVVTSWGFCQSGTETNDELKEMKSLGDENGKMEQ